MARQTGTFTVKDLEGDRHFIAYEAGSEPQIRLLLSADEQPRQITAALVKELNLAIAAIQID